MKNVPDSFSRSEASQPATANPAPLPDAPTDDARSLELSLEFVGRWSHLVSTTNWEKGRIISEWRDALRGSEASTAWSDEAWSRCVGGVSAQHVGRLRRVYERFGDSFESYPGIYWSHFLAALDWDDAEMWLEGAARSAWSVSLMRRTRWEATGGDPDSEPSDSDFTSARDDEDFTPLAEVDAETGARAAPRSVIEGPRADGPDFGDEDDAGAIASFVGADDDDVMPWEDGPDGNVPSPFANLPSLPIDLAEALEQFKLAIIRHRAAAWAEVSPSDVRQALDSLKAFTEL